MDLHPAIVHFPVALLSIYSLVEIMSLFPRLRTPNVEALKRFLVITGVLGAGAAIASGLYKTGGFVGRDQNIIIQLHQGAAFITAGLYVVLGIVYAFSGIAASGEARAVSRHWCIAGVALIALLAVTLTGALGGLMVYGPHDPATKLLHDLLLE